MFMHRCLLWSTAVTLALASSLASATVQRTFVASTGVDNPTCSITSPCRSFAAAITATNSGGEIIVQDSAGYGAVTITKSISIISPPGIYGGISVFSGNGITVNAPGATVVLRGLSINGQGGTHGILTQQATRVRVESCVVSKMGAVGIYHQADNAEMIVLDTISRDNGDGGFALVAKDASIVLDHVRSEHNANVGFYIAPTPGSTAANATIAESMFAFNGSYGLWVDSVSGAGTYTAVDGSIISHNGSHGVLATSAAAGSFVHATLTRNTIGRNGGDGALGMGLDPGGVRVYVTDNAMYNNIGNGATAGGSNTRVFASGNSGAWNPGLGLGCDSGGLVFSLGNNNFELVGSPGCYSVVSGK